MKDLYTYSVIWSAEDQEFVGLCAEFPSLSWLAGTPEGALQGIRGLVAEIHEDLLLERDAKRNIGQEVLDAVTEIQNRGH